MADLRLVSTNKCQLKPLVEGALSNELRLLEAGIRNSGIPGRIPAEFRGHLT